MNKFGLFITRNDIIKSTPLQGSIDADRLIIFAKTAQEKYMLNLLGSVLYNKLQTDIEALNVITGIYRVLLDDYIKPTLIWYTVVEYLPFSGIQFKSEGAVKHESEQSKAVTKNDVDFLGYKSSDTAEFYAKRLQEFLCAKTSEIPEYNQSTGDSTNVWPDKSEQYYSGIHI